MKKKFDLRHIMLKAWQIYRQNGKKVSFAESLHRAWMSEKSKAENERRVQNAKQSAGVEEETNTYSGWLEQGLKVRHGEHSLFKAVLIWASKGDDRTYTASFFSRSQVEAIATA